MKYATVMSCLVDASLPPIDQNTMRFFGKVALDTGFEGMAMDEAEGERLARVLGDKIVLLMGNHGVMVVGPSVARALDDLYYFERACETLVTAYMTGKELRVLPEAVARQTVADWESYGGELSDRHLQELMAILDCVSRFESLDREASPDDPAWPTSERVVALVDLLRSKEFKERVRRHFAVVEGLNPHAEKFRRRLLETDRDA